MYFNDKKSIVHLMNASQNRNISNKKCNIFDFSICSSSFRYIENIPKDDMRFGKSFIGMSTWHKHIDRIGTIRKKWSWYVFKLKKKNHQIENLSITFLVLLFLFPLPIFSFFFPFSLVCTINVFTSVRFHAIFIIYIDIPSQFLYLNNEFLVFFLLFNEKSKQMKSNEVIS